MNNHPNKVTPFLESFYDLEKDKEHKAALILKANQLFDSAATADEYKEFLNRIFENLAKMKNSIEQASPAGAVVVADEIIMLNTLLDALAKHAEKFIETHDELKKPSTDTIKAMKEWSEYIEAHTNSTVQMIAQKEKYPYESAEHARCERIILGRVEKNPNQTTSLGMLCFGIALTVVGIALLANGFAPGASLATAGASFAMGAVAVWRGKQLITESATRAELAHKQAISEKFHKSVDPTIFRQKAIQNTQPGGSSASGEHNKKK